MKTATGEEQSGWYVLGCALLGVLKGAAIMAPVVWLALTYQNEIKAYLFSWGVAP